MAPNETIAVLGAGGTMGRPMARHLAAAGFAVRAWNRSPEKARPLAEHGVQLAQTPAEAADGATVVLTMVSDADAVLGVMDADDGALAAAGDATLWLQMSTIGLEGTRRCAELAERHGLGFVDAPVLGTKAPAEEGKLVALASGTEDVRERAQPILDAFAQRTMWVGEAGAGTALKLAANTWVVALVEGIAETLAFAEGIGLDPALVLEAVGGGPLDLPYLQLKGRMMIERSFEPSFSLALAAKDAALVQETAVRHGIELPLVATIRERLELGAREHGDEDIAATFMTLAGDR
jgi:3-hydroxyisobutyrate dehydrogenase